MLHKNCELGSKIINLLLCCMLSCHQICRPLAIKQPFVALSNINFEDFFCIKKIQKTAGRALYRNNFWKLWMEYFFSSAHTLNSVIATEPIVLQYKVCQRALFIYLNISTIIVTIFNHRTLHKTNNIVVLSLHDRHKTVNSFFYRTPLSLFYIKLFDNSGSLTLRKSIVCN
jgi:hypothetical protein